ncbi:MAG: abortive infection family protein [Propionibacteriaceae bacterium]|nr:abortive infection family protein [Propionibacteriaceae bacterium]
MPDLISLRVRAAFRDFASGIKLRDIDRIWQSENFPPGEANEFGGVRQSRWVEYEASVDWTNVDHCRRALRAYQTVLIEHDNECKTKLIQVLEADGFTIDSKNNITFPVDLLTPLSGLGGLRDVSGIMDAFHRIDALLDQDPPGVVGAVKDLIEATAKTVLEHLQKPVETNAELAGLVSQAQDSLGLGVSSVDESLDSSKSVKKILGSLKGIAIGLTELRNAEGSGHGRARGSGLVRDRPRHIRRSQGSMAETLGSQA